MRATISALQDRVSHASHLICEAWLHISHFLLCDPARGFAVAAVCSASFTDGNRLNFVASRLCMGAVWFWQFPPHCQRWWPAQRCCVSPPMLPATHTLNPEPCSCVAQLRHPGRVL